MPHPVARAAKTASRSTRIPREERDIDAKILGALQDLEGTYRARADYLCTVGDSYGVFHAMKDANSVGAKAHRIRREQSSQES